MSSLRAEGMQILQFFSQLVSDSAKCLQLLAGRTGPHTTPENMMWKLELSNPTVQLVLYTLLAITGIGPILATELAKKFNLSWVCLCLCGYKCYYYSRYTAVISLRQIVILLEPRLASRGRRRRRDGDTAQNYYWILYRRQQLVHLLSTWHAPIDEKIIHPGPQRVLAVGKHFLVVLRGAKCHPAAGGGVRRGGKCWDKECDATCHIDILSPRFSAVQRQCQY